MIITANPWGVTEQFEGQRTDLWTLDLRRVREIVMNPIGVVPTSEFSSYQNAVSLAPENHVAKVTLPEQLINGLDTIQGTQKRFLPGYDEPASGVRVDFIMDAIGDGYKFMPQSAIYGLLNCWFMLAMAGQSRFDRIPLPLSGPDIRPIFMADIPLIFLKGLGAELDEKAEVGYLDSSASYELRDCWISDLQLPDVECSHHQIATITATLQIGAIAPGSAV